jgi:branched-chain amino acid:cation transporter, LIVCS family
LTNIITYSIPVLMFLYPLAVVLMLLTFASPLFNHSRVVYIAGTAVAFMISIIDGLKTLCQTLEIDYFTWMNPIIKFYENVLPLYEEGLGWLLPVLAIMLVTGVLVRLVKTSTVHA